MGSFAGGSHEAEVVATDGAGNTSIRRWTVNVDPEGRITTLEETETLEAVEATSEQAPVARQEAQDIRRGALDAGGLDDGRPFGVFLVEQGRI